MTAIYFGGSPIYQKWRNELISLLNDKVQYFQASNEEQTPEKYIDDLKRFDTCDFCVYGASPEMIGLYSLTVPVIDSEKRPDKVILVLNKKDTDSDFDKQQYDAMSKVAIRVGNNGARVFGSLTLAADFLNRSTKVS